MVDDVLQELDVRLHTADPKFPQCPVGPGTSSGQCGVPRGELDQQRVVERAQDGAGIGGAVQADSQAGGGAISLQPPVIGREPVGRILGRNAALNGETAPLDLVLARDVERALVQTASLRDQDLRAHDVNARDGLGDGVLHLDARIDLDEVPVP